MVITGKKPFRIHLIDIAVDVFHVIIAAQRHGDLFFPLPSLRVFVIKIKMIYLQIRPGVLMRGKLVDIRFICRNAEKTFLIQLLMLAVFVMIRKRNDGIPLLHICFLHLLRRQIPIGNHRMAMQIRLIKVSLFRQ